MTFDKALIDMHKTGREWEAERTRYRVYMSRLFQYFDSASGRWENNRFSYATLAGFDWQPVDGPVAEPKPWNAVDALLRGDRIRQADWAASSYVYMNDGKIWDERGKEIAANPWWAGALLTRPKTWKPYVEPVKLYNHVEAAKLIEDGETVGSGRCGIARWNKEELVFSGITDLNRIATATDFRVVGDKP